MRSFSTFAREHHLGWHHLFVLAEHGTLRTLIFTAGVMLIVLGLGLGVTMIMLPVGIFMALVGVGAVVASCVRDLPLPPDE